MTLLLWTFVIAFSFFKTKHLLLVTQSYKNELDRFDYPDMLNPLQMQMPLEYIVFSQERSGHGIKMDKSKL